MTSLFYSCLFQIASSATKTDLLSIQGIFLTKRVLFRSKTYYSIYYVIYRILQDLDLYKSNQYNKKSILKWNMISLSLKE